jgi:hypothetical protein
VALVAVGDVTAASNATFGGIVLAVLLLAASAFTITGIAVGFALWIGVILAVLRWGPSGDAPSDRHGWSRHHEPGDPRHDPDGRSDDRRADETGSLGVGDAPETCSGTGATPVPLTPARNVLGRKTGVCPVCGCRFRLGAGERLPSHAPAATSAAREIAADRPHDARHR